MAAIGGYGGAAFSRRISASALRMMVIPTGLAVSAYPCFSTCLISFALRLLPLDRVRVAGAREQKRFALLNDHGHLLGIVSAVTIDGMQRWPDRRLLDLLNLKHPIIQAPMPRADSVALARAVSSTGALGSLAAALLRDLARQHFRIRQRVFLSRGSPAWVRLRTCGRIPD